MFKDPDEVERAARDQDADCARVDAAIDAAEKAIAAIEAHQPYPDERRKQLSAIRDRTILVIRDVRHNIMERANNAKQTERWMVQKWLREVNDGKILREFTADLQKVPTQDLLDSELLRDRHRPVSNLLLAVPLKARGHHQPGIGPIDL